MKIKIIKETTGRKVHAFVWLLDNDVSKTSLCGQAEAERYSWETNVNLEKTNCPDCLVEADRLLELGKIKIDKGNILENPLTLLKVAYQEEVTFEQEQEETYGGWQTDYDSSFLGVGLKADTPYHKEYKSLEKINVGDTVYVAWCTYGEGDTFGRASGMFDIVKVSKEPISEEEANDLANKKHNDYFGGVDSVSIDIATVKEEV